MLAVSRPISAKSCTPKWLKMIKGVVQPSRIMPHGKTFAISNMFQCVKWSTNKKSKIFPPIFQSTASLFKKKITTRSQGLKKSELLTTTQVTLSEVPRAKASSMSTRATTCPSIGCWPKGFSKRRTIGVFETSQLVLKPQDSGFHHPKGLWIVLAVRKSTGVGVHEQSYLPVWKKFVSNHIKTYSIWCLLLATSCYLAFRFRLGKPWNAKPLPVTVANGGY